MEPTSTPALGFTSSECVDRCLACYRVCEENIPRCVDKGHAVEHVRLLVDCAEFCRVNAGFLLRDSDHHVLTSKVCAGLCEACAESCDAFHGDADMQQCADLCRSCAGSCRAMASAH